MGLKEYIKRGIKYVIQGVPVNNTTVIVKESAPNQRLEGKKIVITGGGRGLGFYIAHKAVKEGAEVLIVGRDENTLKRAIVQLGNHATYKVLDVQNITEFQNFFECAEKTMDGKIDVLVSNAGISLHEGNFRNVTSDGWDKQFDINLKGSYFLVQEYVKYLEAHSNGTKGNVVVISSERAKKPDDIPYGLTKVALSSFVQCIARKVIEENIRINGVAPGVTTSDMTGYKRDENMYAEWQAGKRIFLPEEVAEVVCFLMSDISNCISGEIITCDQGRYIEHW